MSLVIRETPKTTAAGAFAPAPLAVVPLRSASEAKCRSGGADHAAASVLRTTQALREPPHLGSGPVGFFLWPRPAGVWARVLATRQRFTLRRRSSSATTSPTDIWCAAALARTRATAATSAYARSRRRPTRRRRDSARGRGRSRRYTALRNGTCNSPRRGVRPPRSAEVWPPADSRTRPGAAPAVVVSARHLGDQPSDVDLSCLRVVLAVEVGDHRR